MVQFIEDIIRLSEEETRKRYENTFSDIRFGVVLEDLDLIGAQKAWNYANGPVVTAALSRLDILSPIDATQDIVCTPGVNYVGSKSMEVGIRLENAGNHIASCYLTFVAVDEDGNSKKIGKPYVPVDKEWEERHAAALARKSEHKKIVHTAAFSAEEKAALAAVKGKGYAAMNRGCNLESMYPQERNVHDTIFGGYLMHNALEHAWDTVYEYSGIRPALASIDRINFLRPVNAGALLKMHRNICYVGNTSVGVEIVFEEMHADNPQPITNSCYFTFVGMDDNFKPTAMPKVAPQTKEEEKKFVEGYRRYMFNKNRPKK